MTRMPAYPVGGDSPIASKDAVETFDEPDATVTHTDTEVSGGSIELLSQSGTADAGATAGTASAGGDLRGFIINPNTDADSVTVDTFDAQSGLSGTTYIERLSDNTVLDSTAASSGPITFDVALSSGTDYAVYTDGSSHEMEYADGSATSTTVDIVNGYDDRPASQTYNFRYATISTVATSGSAIVEPDAPDDIYAWDRASFLASPDGETVDVFIEDQNGNELAGPIERGDDIPADPSQNPRFRVDISRADTSNNPTIDALYRRRVL